ncbi:unnamed protein product, partial [Discosporangium mesarthrocarpum]
GVDPAVLQGEEEEVGEGEANSIRPQLGVSLLWREPSPCPEPAAHIFCAWDQGLWAGGSRGAVGEGKRLLLCLVEPRSERLRALAMHNCFAFAASAPSLGGGSGHGGSGAHPSSSAASPVVEVAFVTPCRSAVGLCAKGGGGKGTKAGMGGLEGGPGVGEVATDILILSPAGELRFCRGGQAMTRVLPCIRLFGKELVQSASASGITPVVSQGRVQGSGSGAGPGATGELELLLESGAEVESLSDAVGGCFTLSLLDGRRWRLQVSLEPTSPLVAACLRAWDAMLSPGLADALRVDVVATGQAMVTWARQ